KAWPTLFRVERGRIVSVDSLADSTDYYLGFQGSDALGSPEAVVRAAPKRYTGVRTPAKGRYYLEGLWELRDECAVPSEPGARMVFIAEKQRVSLVARSAQPNDGMLSVQVGGAAPRVLHVTEGRAYDLSISASEIGNVVTVTAKQPGVE